MKTDNKEEKLVDEKPHEQFSRIARFVCLLYLLFYQLS